MQELDAITRLAELGMTAILLAILFALWKEFRDQGKFIRELLLQAEAERKVLALHAGLDTVTLNGEAQAIRADIAMRKQSPN